MKLKVESGQLPVGWKVKKLGEICSFENGDRGKNYPSRSEFLDEGIPFVNAGHLTDEGIDVGNLNYISRKKFNQLGAGKIQPGDLLFCLRGSLGKSAIVDSLKEGAIASSLVIVRSGSCILNKFLMAYFKSSICSEMIFRYSNGAAQPNLSSRSLKDFEIPLPPLLEQERIVTILDEAFEGIDRAIAIAEKNLTNAHELFESYLNTIFTQKGDGWEEKTISEIADVVSGYSFKSEDFSDSKLLKSIKITNVGVREFIVEPGNYLPEIFSKTYNKFAIPKGSIVLALTRSIISTGLKVAVVPDDYHCALLNQRVAALKVDSRLMSEKFLFSYFCTKKVMEYVQGQANTLMQPNFSINDLRKMSVPAPSLEEQNQIILKIEALSNKTQRLETIYRQKIAALKELKQSILQKAFTGELTAATVEKAA